MASAYNMHIRGSYDKILGIRENERSACLYKECILKTKWFLGFESLFGIPEMGCELPIASFLVKGLHMAPVGKPWSVTSRLVKIPRLLPAVVLLISQRIGIFQRLQPRLHYLAWWVGSFARDSHNLLMNFMFSPKVRAGCEISKLHLFRM